jgi:hypothetical protein
MGKESPLYATHIQKKDTTWYNEAHCLGSDTEAFFIDTDHFNYPPELKKICGDCVVKNKCLDFAIKYTMLGYWGGTTEKERRHIKKHAALEKAGSRR